MLMTAPPIVGGASARICVSAYSGEDSPPVPELWVACGVACGGGTAQSEYCMFFSADLQEPVELIGMLYDKIREGYDLVGVQKGEVQIGTFEKLFSRMYARLIQKHAVAKFPKGGINNVMFNAKIRDNLNRHVEANSSIFLQILSMGYRFTMITCNYRERERGKSKWTLSKKIKLFIDSFVAFSFAPIRFISVLGMVLAFFGFLFGLAVVLIRVFHLYPLSLGWPSLISVLTIGSGSPIYPLALLRNIFGGRWMPPAGVRCFSWMRRLS